MRKILPFSLIISFLLFTNILPAQNIDSTSFELVPRFSFYTFEKEGEFLLHIPDALLKNDLSVTIITGSDTLKIWKGKPGRKILRLPFSQDLKPAVYPVKATVAVKTKPGKVFTAGTLLTILSYKSNEVKTDRLTGGLIVNGLPFFPFGFYCYSPVEPTLPEEEIIRGFNMISPYQKISPETISERRAYMDRCAQIGMKVHYNLLSVSGGGGVGSRIEGLGNDEKRKRLIDEIIAFRDHPALLGWYIADEPNGYKIPPEELEKIYRTVKENDPWHPVSIVFMAPFLASKKYADALDVVMADPYPLPDLPVSMVGNVAEQLSEEFTGKRPVWMVPQAFGGGELWSREPTMQEIRSMTWQSIIRGATGIQYFVRQAPNYFPKSTSTWDECGRIATEVAELTPWLLSDEEPLPVVSDSKDIIVTSKMHNGLLVVLAVNKSNQPVSTIIRIKGTSGTNARVVFENRNIPLKGGTIMDYIGSYGTQAYMIDMKQSKASGVPDKNLINDSGFEDLSSPGVPSACYARPGGDKGATYFLDSREHYEGNHSLRLITPVQDKPVTIRFFPFKVKPGSTYMISLWAKSDPGQRFRLPGRSENKSIMIAQPQFVDLLMGDFYHAWFVPSKEWKKYVTFITIPGDTASAFKTNLILRMPGQGIAWFDQISVTEEK